MRKVSLDPGPWKYTAALVMQGPTIDKAVTHCGLPGHSLVLHIVILFMNPGKNSLMITNGDSDEHKSIKKHCKGVQHCNNFDNNSE